MFENAQKDTNIEEVRGRLFGCPSMSLSLILNKN